MNQKSLTLKIKEIMNSKVMAVTVDFGSAAPFGPRLEAVTVATAADNPIKVGLSDSEVEAQALMKQLLEGDSLKICFDAKHVLKTLRQNGWNINGRFFDIQIADQLLRAGLSRGERDFEKITEAHNVTEATTEGKIFALRDVLKQKLAEAKLTGTAVTEFAVIRPVVAMELNGMLLNRAEAIKLREADPNGTDYARHINPFTGRVHATYNQLGTDTGRFTCVNPNIHGVKKSWRQCFVAPPGYKLIDGDYCQQELRILAEITGDNALLEEFARDADVYKSIAAKMFEKPYNMVADTERKVAKTIVIGLIYGMGINRLHAELSSYGLTITPSQAEQFKAGFFRQYPKIKAWYSLKQRTNDKDARSLGGRRRLWNSDAPFTELCNTPIQATGADILKHAMVELSKELVNADIKLIACVHDEIILEAPAAKAQEVKSLLQRVMQEAGHKYLKKVSLKVDVEVSDSWH